jgi:hypothetical protein
MAARLRIAAQHGFELSTNAMVIAQVWRDARGRQAQLAQLLQAVDIRPVSRTDGEQAGLLLAAAGTSDPVDATVVLLARAGDRIITSDVGGLSRLAAAAATGCVIVAC